MGETLFGPQSRRSGVAKNRGAHTCVQAQGESGTHPLNGVQHQVKLLATSTLVREHTAAAAWFGFEVACNLHTKDVCKHTARGPKVVRIAHLCASTRAGVARMAGYGGPGTRAPKHLRCAAATPCARAHAIKCKEHPRPPPSLDRSKHRDSLRPPLFVCPRPSCRVFVRKLCQAPKASELLRANALALRARPLRALRKYKLINMFAWPLMLISHREW